MKRILFFLIVLSGFQCISQETDEPIKIRFDLPANGDPIQNDRARIFTIKSSPYLNETHKEGIVINGGKEIVAFLRYNAYYDVFQYKDENGKKVFVLKSPKIKIALDGKTYHLLPYEETVQDRALYYVPEEGNKKLTNKKEGYFCALSDGETILYSKTTKRLPKFQLPANGYEQFEPTDLVTLTHYYIKRKHRPAVRIKLSKKEVLLALNNKYNELRSYIKNNNLKIKTVEEVIQVISYYDTLE